MGRQEVIERKEEAGHARQDRGCKKERGPTIKPFRAEHTEQDDEPGENSHQTQDNVNQSERGCRDSQNHGTPPLEDLLVTSPASPAQPTPRAQHSRR